MTTETNIRDAAVRLFAAKGFAGTGIRDLARDVGITTSTLYHYVGTKDDLLRDIMLRGLGSLLERGGTAVADSDDPAVQLASLVRMHTTVHALSPLTCAVVDGEVRSLPTEVRKDVVALRDRYEEVWQSVLEAGRQTGIFTLDDPHLTRLHLLDLCTGVMRWYRPDGERSLDSIVDHVVDMSLLIVGARRGSRRLRVADLPPAAPTEPASLDEVADRRRSVS
ncbi:TetR/AcrR family transcriptional regulator [Streptomyces sp. NPDC002623]